MSSRSELTFVRGEPFDEKRLNGAMNVLDARLRALESFLPTWEAAVAALRSVGLSRVSEALVPIFEEAQSIRAGLQALADLGLDAGQIAETAERQWLTSVARAAIHDDAMDAIRDGVDGARDTLAKLALSLDAGLASKAGPADIAAAITALKGGAGAALDTLAELAAALDNDADYAASVTAALATRAVKTGDAYSGAHDFGAAAVTLPRATTVAGASVPAVSAPVLAKLAADFVTTSTSMQEALLGPEIARIFSAPAGDTTVVILATHHLYSNRPAPAAGTDVAVQMRTKTGGVWGAWTTLGTSGVRNYANSGGASAISLYSGCADAFSAALPPTATHYQVRTQIACNAVGASPTSQLRHGSALLSWETSQ